MSHAEQCLRFLLGHYAGVYGVTIQSFVVMGNHVHITGTDIEGNLPRFAQDLFSQSARFMNHVLGRTENFWAPAPFNGVRLIRPEDALEKAVYTMANPVAAGLVDRSERWPGAISRLMDFGKIRSVSRPHRFFRAEEDGGSLPTTSSIRLVPPPGWELDDWRRAVESRLRDVENDLCEARGPKGCLGVNAIRSIDPNSQPDGDANVRGDLRPTIACRDRKLLLASIAELRAWRAAYADALALWQAGLRDVEFPFGTWKMRVVHSACCAGHT